MKFEDLTNEQIEEAKACTNLDEKLAFLQKYSIEVPDDMLDDVSGGKIGGGSRNDCPKGGKHRWVATGKQRPGAFWGDAWKDDEKRCEKCGALDWFY